MSQLLRKHNFHEVFDSQGVFRLILEAMSNPGRVVSIKFHADKLFGNNPFMLALAMTLLDTEVSFNTCENRELSDEIVSLTLSRREQLSDADFVFVCNQDNLSDVISNAKCGTLSDPHKSATLIVQNGGKDVYPMCIHGPGIDGKQTVFVSELVKQALQLRDNQCYEYPQGIDYLFINDAGEMFAIPRLIRQEVKDDGICCSIRG